MLLMSTQIEFDILHTCSRCVYANVNANAIVHVNVIVMIKIEILDIVLVNVNDNDIRKSASKTFLFQ